jgi:hypothetical protein
MFKADAGWIERPDADPPEIDEIEFVDGFPP